MKASLQFFSTEHEQYKFLTEFEGSDFDNVKKEEWETLFNCGAEYVQFLPSKKYDNIITEGRIAIRTMDENNNSLRCEKLFKKMRRWFKDNYNNNLVCYNFKTQEKKDGDIVKNWWLSPDAEKKLLKNSIQLKQTKGSFVVFEKLG